MSNTTDYLFPMEPISGSSRKHSPKQAKVISYARDHGHITLQEAVDLIGTNIYANACKHVGVILSNMVRRGMLERVKKGVFCLPEPR